MINNISHEHINILKYICKETFPNSELLEWDYNNEKEKNENEVFIFFAFHKSDKNLFYVGYIQSKERKRISHRVLNDKINNNANTFKTTLKKNYLAETITDNEINEKIKSDVSIYYIKTTKPKEKTRLILEKYKSNLRGQIKKSIIWNRF